MNKTVRQEVLDFLKANPGVPYTNGDIAFELALPEPSVRRATLALEKATAIHYHAATTRGRSLWMAS